MTNRQFDVVSLISQWRRARRLVPMRWIARVLFVGLLLSCSYPATASISDVVFTIEVESPDGAVTKAQVPRDRGHVDGDTLSWQLTEPMALLDAAGNPLAVLESASVTYVADPVIDLNFAVSTSSSVVNFTLTSANLAFANIPNAIGRAFASATVSGDGVAVLTGDFPGNDTYRAFYNDPGDISATGTPFATLAPGISSTAGAATTSEGFPDNAGSFSTTDESGGALSGITSMSAQWRITVGPNSIVTGNSTFIIFPADVCGNTVVETGEECDDGNNVDADGCQGNCLLPVCGDGIVDTGQGEACDDGNTVDGDGCQANCLLPVCGDGIVDAGQGEECDDGNNVDADGCQGNCLLPVCGDGIVDTGQGEACDDGNTVDGDGCQANCLLPVCGDGIVDAGQGEECDDGNNVDADGCQGNCLLPVCGDGILDGNQGEECDDGNTVDGDGCQGDCRLPFCGDGIVDAGEGCDDGNNVDLDGCSASCQLEGACCSDGPGTESECFITTEAGCAMNGNSALYLGDTTTCTSDIDCFALAVTMDTMSAEATSEGVLIRWITALEVDTVGFRILREMPGTAEGREKTIVVVAPMIAAKGNQLEGSSYVFLDNARESEDALVYYIEDLNVFGKVTRHGPISIERGEREAPASRGVERNSRQR